MEQATAIAEQTAFLRAVATAQATEVAGRHSQLLLQATASGNGDMLLAAVALEAFKAFISLAVWWFVWVVVVAPLVRLIRGRIE